MSPTLLDLADCAPPPGIDGRSWLSLVEGRADETRGAVVRRAGRADT